MLIILELELNRIAVDTTSFIDLFNSDLCTMLYSQTVNCCAAGYRADTTDLKGSAICCCTAFSCLALTFCLASPAAAVVVDAEPEPPHAVKDAAITTAKPALKNLFFIIVSSSHDCI